MPYRRAAGGQDRSPLTLRFLAAVTDCEICECRELLFPGYTHKLDELLGRHADDQAHHVGWFGRWRLAQVLVRQLLGGSTNLDGPGTGS
jgi:hypothetical protein